MDLNNIDLANDVCVHVWCVHVCAIVVDCMQKVRTATRPTVCKS